jgi:hypothetical protein
MRPNSSSIKSVNFFAKWIRDLFHASLGQRQANKTLSKDGRSTAEWSIEFWVWGPRDERRQCHVDAQKKRIRDAAK